MALHFYAQKQFYKDGTPQTPLNYPYPTRPQAERQFYLLCAAAIANTNGDDFVSVEYGTIEQGKIDRKFWDHTPPTPEPEPVEGEQES